MRINRRGWIIWLIVWGIIVLILSSLFTIYITGRLKQGEFDKVKALKYAYDEISKDNENLDKDITFESYFVEQNKTIPLIVTDERDDIILAINFGPKLDTNNTFLRKELRIIKAKEREPFEVTNFANQTQYIYYKNTQTLRLLALFPYFQLLLITAFIGIGFYGFQAANRAEKNYIWAGMAKETAHQLGTPISAILAWIEILKGTKEKDDPEHEIVEELERDVDRLSLIADRFSKIGSKPILEKIDFVEIAKSSVSYMKRRAPRQVKFILTGDDTGHLYVRANVHLFEWVTENMIRNALDAMDGRGNIILNLYTTKKEMCLDISDTGSGISHNRHKKIFQPGYSTKSRGWGLGLSLAKRIVEEYHHGRIFVKESKPNEGTTFTLALPKYTE